MAPTPVVRVVTVVAAISGWFGLGPPAASQPADRPPPSPVIYEPPVDAPVVDGFRPPVTPFGPGNRGLEYASTPGTPVRAAAPGRVVFAGPVAGTLHVTVVHADGVRTSYSFLASVAVHEGDHVDTGTPLGTAGTRLFFSARVGDAYLDPAALLAAGEVHVRLVPEGPAPPARDEAHALRALDRLEGTSDPSALRAAVAWARARAGAAGAALASATTRASTAVKGALARLLPGFVPASHAATMIAPVLDWWSRRHHCTPPEVRVAPPAGRHVAVLVGGLGSSSVDAAIDDLDTAGLGYEAGDVIRFSYAGGRTPDPTDRIAVTASPYTPVDTLGDLRDAAHRLVLLLDAVAAATPGATVDVLAHSQGGLVARHALALIADRPHDDPTRAALGTVVAFGAPHQGADLATVVAALEASPGGRAALDAIRDATGTVLNARAPAVSELAQGSSFLAELAVAPAPAHVPLVSIAARGDVVVPAGRSRMAGATNVIVSVPGWSDHEHLPSTPAATREAALALAGLPAGCESFLDVVADGVGSSAISAAEDAVGSFLNLAAWVVSPLA